MSQTASVTPSAAVTNPAWENANRPDRHYLQKELDTLFQTDLRMWDFLQTGSLDGIWYWNLEHLEDEWMSPAFWTLFGIDPTTKRHDPEEWQDLIFPEDLERAKENLAAHCADPDHAYDQICRYYHADGSTVWVRCRGLAIRDDTGRAIRMLGAHTDVTYFKRLEQEALQKSEDLERANADLRTFAYGISHDLKSPANTAKMLIAEIQSDTTGRLSDDQTDLLNHAGRTIDRMSDLIEGVLEYARLVGETTEASPVDLGNFVREIVEDHHATVRDCDAHIEIGTLPTVFGNPQQLRAMFQNLVENGLKYTRPDTPPVLRIDGESSAKGAVIRIADNGIGIEPRHQSRIFDMFARLHTRDLYAGTGLGLSVCERVARNHGGRIEVESSPGHGSIFTVILPKEDATCPKPLTN